MNSSSAPSTNNQPTPSPSPAPAINRYPAPRTIWQKLWERREEVFSTVVKGIASIVTLLIVACILKALFGMLESTVAQCQLLVPSAATGQPGSAQDCWVMIVKRILPYTILAERLFPYAILGVVLVAVWQYNGPIRRLLDRIANVAYAVEVAGIKITLPQIAEAIEEREILKVGILTSMTDSEPATRELLALYDVARMMRSEVDGLDASHKKRILETAIDVILADEKITTTEYDALVGRAKLYDIKILDSIILERWSLMGLKKNLDIPFIDLREASAALNRLNSKLEKAYNVQQQQPNSAPSIP